MQVCVCVCEARACASPAMLSVSVQETASLDSLSLKSFLRAADKELIFCENILGCLTEHEALVKHSSLIANRGFLLEGKSLRSTEFHVSTI